jgi:hypothetical protein
MVVIRNVFRCKPGQAKALVAKLKGSFEVMEREGTVKAGRVMTDVATTFWTVVFETEVESLGAWESAFSTYGSNPEIQKAMDGYMDLVEGGHREIWRVE